MSASDTQTASLSDAQTTANSAARGYGRGAGILSVGVALTGLVTFAYFSLASHSLSEVDYKGVSLLTRHGKVEEIRSPFPWSMLLVRVD